MKKTDIPRLLFADEKGRIYPFTGLEAAGMKAGRFFHPDPSDRILVATARLERLTLLTGDAKILAYPHVASRG